MMRRVNGDTFLRAREESIYLTAIPVFVISATHVASADIRIQGFLAKPFAVDHLLQMLRKVCSPHCTATGRSACLNFTVRSAEHRGAVGPVESSQNAELGTPGAGKFSRQVPEYERR